MAILTVFPKKGKNGHFWPFFWFMPGRVHFILPFFHKNLSLIRGFLTLFGDPRKSSKIPLFDPKIGLPGGQFWPSKRPSKPLFLRGLFGLQPARTPTPTPEHYLRARLGPVAHTPIKYIVEKYKEWKVIYLFPVLPVGTSNSSFYGVGVGVLAGCRPKRPLKNRGFEGLLGGSKTSVLRVKIEVLGSKRGIFGDSGKPPKTLLSKTDFCEKMAK